MANYYIKLVDSFLNSRQIKRLEKQPDGHSLVLLLIHIMSDTKNTEGVLLDDVGSDWQPMDAEIIHDEHPSFSVDLIEKAFQIYENMGLIQHRDDGFLEFVDYEGLINTPSQAKQKRYRQRQKELTNDMSNDVGNDTGNDVGNDVTDCVTHIHSHSHSQISEKNPNPNPFIHNQRGVWGDEAAAEAEAGEVTFTDKVPYIDEPDIDRFLNEIGFDQRLFKELTTRFDNFMIKRMVNNVRAKMQQQTVENPAGYLVRIIKDYEAKGILTQNDVHKIYGS